MAPWSSLSRAEEDVTTDGLGAGDPGQGNKGHLISFFHKGPQVESKQAKTWTSVRRQCIQPNSRGDATDKGDESQLALETL